MTAGDPFSGVVTATTVYGKVVEVGERVAQVDSKVDQVDQKVTGVVSRVDDHESRIRRLERALWLATGAAATAGGAVGSIASQLLHGSA